MRIFSKIALIVLVLMSLLLIRFDHPKYLINSNGIMDQNKNKTHNANQIANMYFNETFDLELYELLNKTHYPTLSASVIINDTIVWANAYGHQPSIDTVFYLASITKTVTATAIMQLFENNLLDLDASASEYLPFNLTHPEYPNISITIKHLLSHLSGLYFDSDHYWDISKDGTYIFPDWLGRYLTPTGDLYQPDIWSNKTPGTYFYYANVNFAILQGIVEYISNQSFEDYCQNNIFMPLNMSNTSFNLSNFNHNQLAIPMGWAPHFQSYYVMTHADFNYSAKGDAGLKTTALDFSNFLIAHMNGGEFNGTRILSENNTNYLHTTQVNLTTGSYGLGWTIGPSNSWIGHDGGLYPSFQARMRFFTTENGSKVGYILLLNNVDNDCINRAFMCYHYLEKKILDEVDAVLNDPTAIIDYPRKIIQKTEISNTTSSVSTNTYKSSSSSSSTSNSNSNINGFASYIILLALLMVLPLKRRIKK
ncbi:MAG: serine hydrolase domain-containing protein [Candidatus Hodarchaeales archaeon]|jgi:CubicO group peptidase (beta-lactamase class C family)